MPTAIEPDAPMSRSRAEVVAANAVTAWEQLERAGQVAYVGAVGATVYASAADDSRPSMPFLPPPSPVEADRSHPGSLTLFWATGDQLMVLRVGSSAYADISFNHAIHARFVIDADAPVSREIAELIDTFMGWEPASACQQDAFYAEAVRVLMANCPPVAQAGQGGCCGGSCGRDGVPTDRDNRSKPAMSSTDDFPQFPAAGKGDLPPDTTNNGDPPRPPYRHAMALTPAGAEPPPVAKTVATGPFVDVQPKPTMAALNATRDRRVSETMPFAKAEVKAAIPGWLWLLIGQKLVEIVAAILKARDKVEAGELAPPI